MTNSSVSLNCRRWVTQPILNNHPMEDGVIDRQQEVPGFDQVALQKARIALIGAGGLGGQVAWGLVRKGVGVLKVFDDDEVALSNLNRQHFYPKDLYKNKALCLGENLAGEATCGTIIEAYTVSFQEAVDQNYLVSLSLAMCLVDNDETRKDAAIFCRQQAKSCVFAGVTQDASSGYVFVQEPGKACLQCLFPDLGKGKSPCPGVPAVLDILATLGGLALYAVDSLLMERKRSWNYRAVSLPGFSPDVCVSVDKRSACELCGCQ